MYNKKIINSMSVSFSFESFDSVSSDEIMEELLKYEWKIYLLCMDQTYKYVIHVYVKFDILLFVTYAR